MFSHGTCTYVFLEIAGNKLGPVIRDDLRVRPGEFLPGALDNDFNVSLGHGFSDLPVHDIAAVAVQDAQKIVESAGDIEMGHIDVPVVVRQIGLVKTFALAVVARLHLSKAPAFFRTRYTVARLTATILESSNGSARIDWVPISRTLKQTLLCWRQERPYKNSEFVFSMFENGVRNSGHNPGDPFRVRQHFMKNLRKKANVKRFGFHAIRHLSAVILYKEGEEISTIQKILRHQHATTTDRYLVS